MNVNDIDLNLLKIFAAIHSERSVSRAALRIGLTQPSVSHGLARLRTLFGDALFVRVKGGVEPTPVARRIAPALGDALHAVQTVLDEALAFDPSTAKRLFRIHMSDLGEMVFLPPLMKAIRHQAPGVSVETRQIEWDELPAELESDAVDMAIGHLPSLLGEFAHQHLFREEYVTLRRSPASDSPTRGSARAPADYIAITSHPPTLAILRESGLIDRVKLSIPHFMVVPAILAEVDYAVIVPRTVARAFRRYGINRISPLPVPQRHFDVGLFWTRRLGSEPGHAWLRALMIDLFHQPRQAPAR
ncbi:MAG: LysR family transcriptional regulator [Burkholderiaceae bacterium]